MANCRLWFTGECKCIVLHAGLPRGISFLNHTYFATCPFQFILSLSCFVNSIHPFPNFTTTFFFLKKILLLARSPITLYIWTPIIAISLCVLCGRAASERSISLAGLLELIGKETSEKKIKFNHQLIVVINGARRRRRSRSRWSRKWRRFQWIPQNFSSPKLW